jgi:mono/diheme cytochrome c family protein
MKHRFASAVITLLGAAALAACSSSTSPSGGTGGSSATTNNTGSAHPATATSGTVERGKYLVDNVLMCGVCHTPTGKDGTPNLDLYLAGSRSYDFTDVDGTVVTVNAENLTSHNPEGLYNWTDEQVRTAITKGVDDEMVAIYPIMPFPEYALLEVKDVDSIIQYLRTVAPNDNVVAADYPYGDQNPPVQLADDSEIPHTTLASSDPDYAAAERGRYIGKTACLYCHTEELSSGVPNMKKAFAGGKTYTFIRGSKPNTSTNITPAKSGLSDWSVDDIVSSLANNTEKGTGRTLCSTHPGGPARLGAMTDSDRRDLAIYLHTLPPVENGPFQCEQ